MAILMAVSCVFSFAGCQEKMEEYDAKPVIYLYPESKTDVTVKLDYAGELTCTYPEYQDGWKVTASPDGTLTDADGQTYNYLYWEGENSVSYDFSSGYCVALMKENPYNLIAFQSDVYTQAAQLSVDPTPDTVIRAFMAWKPLKDAVEIPAQDLTAPDRTGFTVVEWGGSQVR